MKIIPIKNLLAFLLVALIFSGCKKSDTDYFPTKYQNMMRENALMEAAFDDILKVSENVLMNNNDAKIETAGAPLGCITDIDSVVTGPTSKTYTINFPSSCTSYDGKTRSGTLVVELEGTNYNTDGSSLTIHLNNYFINGNSLQGKLVCNNLGSGVFKVVVSDEANTGWASMTFADGGKVSMWKTTHKRTIYEGNTDAIIINNKYKISSFDESANIFDGITTEGLYYTGTLENDLLLDYGCIASGNLRYPIDGEINFVMNHQRRKVDYGDGTCDYAVTMYSGGLSQAFNLY